MRQVLEDEGPSGLALHPSPRPDAAEGLTAPPPTLGSRTTTTTEEFYSHTVTDEFHDCDEGDDYDAGAPLRAGRPAEAARSRQPSHIPLERIETPDWFETPAPVGSSNINPSDLVSQPMRVPAEGLFPNTATVPESPLSVHAEMTGQRNNSAWHNVFGGQSRPIGAADQPARVDPRQAQYEACVTERNTFLDLRPPTLPLRRIVTEPVRITPSNPLTEVPEEAKFMQATTSRASMAASSSRGGLASSGPCRFLTDDGFDRTFSDRRIIPTMSKVSTDDGFDHSRRPIPPLAGLSRISTDDGFDRPQALLSLGMPPPGMARNLSRDAALPGYPPFEVPAAPMPASEPPREPAPINFGFPEEAPSAPPVVAPGGEAQAKPEPLPREVVDEALATFSEKTAEVRRPNMLEQKFGPHGSTTVSWAVDAKKLDSQDKQHVSPQFEVRFPGQDVQTFQLVIYPTVINDGRRGAGFKKAKGRGRVMLKCQSLELPVEYPEVTFQVRIGNGDMAQPFRGPVTHSFQEQSVCGLNKKKEEWDLKSGVDSSRTVTITIDISPRHKLSWLSSW